MLLNVVEIEKYYGTVTIRQAASQSSGTTGSTWLRLTASQTTFLQMPLSSREKRKMNIRSCSFDCLKILGESGKAIWFAHRDRAFLFTFLSAS